MPSGHATPVPTWVGDALVALSVKGALAVERGFSTTSPRPGLYAIHAQGVVWIELGLGEAPDERPLYVGKSESSFAGRDVRTHFGHTDATRSTSVTGYSTLRRSLAALLHDSH